MSTPLANLFEQHGTSVRTSRTDSLPLIDPASVWYVSEGHLDITAMAVIREDGAPSLSRTHLMRIMTGDLFFGFHGPPGGRQVVLLGSGSDGGRIIKLQLNKLMEITADKENAQEVALAIDRWVSALCELCTGDLAPSGALNLRPETTVELEQDRCLQPQSGVLWVKPLEGTASFLDYDGMDTIASGVVFPLSSDAWLTTRSPFRAEARRASSIDLDEAYWRGLDSFHRVAESVIDLQRLRNREKDRHRLIRKSEADQSTLEEALTDLESILQHRPHLPGVRASADELLAACRLVAEPLGIEIRDDRYLRTERKNSNPLEDIAKRSQFALRRVALTEKWHRQDNGPLLGFMGSGDEPVALIPRSACSYTAHHVRERRSYTVTDRAARRFDPMAFMFYRTLPARPLNGFDLVGFAAQRIWRDLLTVFLIGSIGGLLTLGTPVAIGYVFDAIIPGSERLQLLHLALILIVAAFATAAFHITRNIALIRVQYRAGDPLQAAVFERLLNLNAGFFKDYSAGDLGIRAMGIDNIMNLLSTSVTTTIVTSLFSVFSIGLLFYYSPFIALVALGLVAVVLIVVITSGVMQLRYKRQLETSHGAIQSMLLQLVNGIAKIRVAAAEDRAFAQWAGKFAHHTRLRLQSRIIDNRLDVFIAFFPVVTSIVIFALVADGADGSVQTLSTGSFLAFLAAFTSLLTAMTRLGSTLVNVLNVLPIYARLKPILEATPEVDSDKTDPGALRGRIEISNVSFRYDPDGPLILDDVSFHAEPGEFVALVGPSGSGKSTLFRILLGFEQPDSGSIAYDGFDASGLDPRALRRQLGVVLQDGDLLPGDIFTNIVGSTVNLTIDDAWEAARHAGLAKDIEEMPMGMHTILAEGAGTISGGQRQRLMIARALVTRPRIVFFDEATSALDNPSQAIVTKSLDQLRSTRIVIAHRLSTIINADRIFVLERGRIVQQGTYDELVNEPGMFQALVKRQIA
ncbi:MAG: NHLP bacteriocin export ABC transporter permease/ATPase subunit [Planctomycetes bacterium]|nr:NHLP bacteriocin export ABC transporter permease/ATPase subunit [Planctomycetota bacterium]